MRPGISSTCAIGVSKSINNITRTCRITGHYRSRNGKCSTTIIGYSRRRRRCSCSWTSHCRSSCRWHCYHWRCYSSGMCPCISSTRAISVSKRINNISRTSRITSYHRSRSRKRSTTIICYSWRCWRSCCSRASHCRSRCSRHSYHRWSYSDGMCPGMCSACAISIGECVNNIS